MFGSQTTPLEKEKLKSCMYKYLSKEGVKYGYHVNETKSFLIVKSEELASEVELVFGGEVNISTEGKRHLGAVIGSKYYKEQYYDENISKWKEELNYVTHGNCEKLTTLRPHCLYKGLQVQIYILHANNLVF